MSTNSVVTVKYGPYESCGIVEQRTFRLDGLQAVLKDDGHQCVIEKTVDWNTVELIVNGECVYTCNITDLDFGNLRQHLKPSAFWMIRDVMLMNIMRTEYYAEYTPTVFLFFFVF
uniref:Chromosome 10 open reading frame 53 n=1 Tax=Sinocyclocheilus anshuiensis TaxID=1608454 RepID=A0A671PJR4_9TELE